MFAYGKQFVRAADCKGTSGKPARVSRQFDIPPANSRGNISSSSGRGGQRCLSEPDSHEKNVRETVHLLIIIVNLCTKVNSKDIYFAKLVASSLRRCRYADIFGKTPGFAGGQ